MQEKMWKRKKFTYCWNKTTKKTQQKKSSAIYSNKKFVVSSGMPVKLCIKQWTVPATRTIGVWSKESQMCRCRELEGRIKRFKCFINEAKGTIKAPGRTFAKLSTCWKLSIKMSNVLILKLGQSIQMAVPTNLKKQLCPSNNLFIVALKASLKFIDH